MGQDVKRRSEVCPLPPGPLKDLNRHLRPRTIFMAVSLTFILTTTGLVYYRMPPSSLPSYIRLPPIEPPTVSSLVPGTPHSTIAIDGDANFSDTALLEGWPGDGSPENPYIIDGLDFNEAGEEGSCISISNTQVSFIIGNCSLSGASYSYGIDLENVTHGKLVKNIIDIDWRGIVVFHSNYSTIADNIFTNSYHDVDCWSSSHNTFVNNTCLNSRVGISLSMSSTSIVAGNTCYNCSCGITISSSESNTVTDNTCYNNGDGICLDDSHSNTVENNTCNSNFAGISLRDSDSSTVANNTCYSNKEDGISLHESDSNTVANNTCSGNEFSGIGLEGSHSNTVANNTCSYNDIGISLKDSDWNTVANNIFTNNRIDIDAHVYELVVNTLFRLSILGIGLALPVAGYRMVKLSKGMSDEEYVRSLRRHNYHDIREASRTAVTLLENDNGES